MFNLLDERIVVRMSVVMMTIDDDDELLSTTVILDDDDDDDESMMSFGAIRCASIDSLTPLVILSNLFFF